MSQVKSQAALKQYAQVGAHSGIVYANPHQLVQMLLSGALDRVAMAKGYMSRGDIGQKVECIGRTIAIIDGLRMSLNKEMGGELARNLDDLYDYMARKLLEANTQDKSELLDEVASLLGEIKDAWDAIPESAIASYSADPDSKIKAPAVG